MNGRIYSTLVGSAGGSGAGMFPATWASLLR